MIRVPKVPEPPEFEKTVRRPGKQWQENNPDRTEYPGYWARVRIPLAEGFENRCGYTAMWLPPYEGQVDHFIAQADDRSQVYEWSNFRYVSPSLNAKKKAGQKWLDPFDVENDWFELNAFTLELRLTDKVPDSMRDIAERTLDKLGLRDSPALIRQRRSWYDAHAQKGGDLDWLRQCAPLVASAIEKLQEEGPIP